MWKTTERYFQSSPDRREYYHSTLCLFYLYVLTGERGQLQTEGIAYSIWKIQTNRQLSEQCLRVWIKQRKRLRYCDLLEDNLSEKLDSYHNSTWIDAVWWVVIILDVISFMISEDFSIVFFGNSWKLPLRHTKSSRISSHSFHSYRFWCALHQNYLRLLLNSRVSNRR